VRAVAGNCWSHPNTLIWPPRFNIKLPPSSYSYLTRGCSISRRLLHRISIITSRPRFSFCRSNLQLYVEDNPWHLACRFSLVCPPLPCCYLPPSTPPPVVCSDSWRGGGGGGSASKGRGEQTIHKKAADYSLLSRLGCRVNNR
jgi:hypothetical protein